MNDKETLEEAAENFRSNNSGTMQGGNNTKILNAFKSGAKWQEQRMYSEEDMLEFGEWMKVLPLTISGFVVKTKTKSIVVEETKDLLQIWFEQFKKK